MIGVKENRKAFGRFYSSGAVRSNNEGSCSLDKLSAGFLPLQLKQLWMTSEQSHTAKREEEDCRIIRFKVLLQAHLRDKIARF